VNRVNSWVIFRGQVGCSIDGKRRRRRHCVVDPAELGVGYGRMWKSVPLGGGETIITLLESEGY